MSIPVDTDAGPTLTTAWPLRIYYDAQCPLCTRELHALVRHDVRGRLQLVDCSGGDFDDPDASRAGLDAGLLMRRIHAIDATGRWCTGVTVFEAAYRAVGMDTMARTWAHPWLRPLWDRIYPWIADHRMLLSGLHLDGAFGWLVERAARRAARRQVARAEAGCVTKACAVPPATPPARNPVP